MHSKIFIPFFAAALSAVAISTMAMADQSVDQSANKTLVTAATAEARATITAIDQSTRMVTLRGADGKTFTVEAGPRVEHLDQFKVGDVVQAAYTESLAFEVVANGEKPQGVQGTVKRIPGGGVVGKQVTSSFRIASVDPQTNILWVTLPSGDTKKIHVQDPTAQQHLKTLSPGNVVAVTYTESLAIRLEKLAAK